MAGILSALSPVFKIILEVVLGLIWEKSNEPDTAVDADRDAELRSRLEHRVQEHKNSAHSTR